MRLALWTPAPESPWARTLAAELAAPLTLVAAQPAAPPAVDLDLYHLAGAPAHGFVYRALLQRPGVVLLEEWNLHALVHAETAGRGDAPAYLREARHAHGDTGAFVARQVLAGLEGSLSTLTPLNQRALERSLALVAFTEDLRARAAARLPGRPVVHVPLARLGAGPDEASAPGRATSATSTLLDLARQLVPHADAERRVLLERTRAEASPGGRALDELGWVARELGLAEAPADAAALVASLFGGRS